jgi:ketosteroid isomerase-like protein
VGKLRPSSRLRQAIVWRSFELATEALNRRDLDAAFIGYRPDREYHPPAEFVAAGFMKPCYRGPEGFRTYMSEWSDVWGRDLRVEVAELIDVGEHLVVLGAVPSRAQASGVPLSQKWASVFTLNDGQVISQHDYFDHAEALEASGCRSRRCRGAGG